MFYSVEDNCQCAMVIMFPATVQEVGSSIPAHAYNKVSVTIIVAFLVRHNLCSFDSLTVAFSYPTIPFISDCYPPFNLYKFFCTSILTEATSQGGSSSLLC